MLSQQAHGLRNAICRTKYHGYWTTRSSFSTSLRRNGYDSTIQNLKIGAHTRVIFQGFTGKQATANAKESIQWGTNVVGGVKPNGSGEHLGLPVLPSVRAAMEQLKPDATGIYVAAHQATAAIEEAIKAEVPLIVAVAEHIPLHDMMRIHSMLQSQSKSRLIGANAPGIISAIGRCRIGFQPLPTFSPGHIGIVAKSGTLSYETVGSLTRAGLGQSLCIAVGGDVIAGTNFVDALKVFEHDKDTEAIIVVGELGGTIEEEAADWIINYRRRVKDPKPIAAVIGGFQAPHGKVMGHAGAWVGLGEGAISSATTSLIPHVSLLASASGSSHRSNTITPKAFPSSHSRAINSSSQKPQHPSDITPPKARHQHIISEYPPHRSNRSPSIIAAPTANPSQLNQRVRRFPFDYRSGPSAGAIADAIAHLQLDAAPPKAKAQVVQLIHNLWTLYTEKEAIDAHVNLALSVDDDELLIYSPYLFFDDAAFKSGKRQAHLHALRDEASISATDQQAEDAGIVYVPLASPVFPTGTRQKGTQTSPSSAAKDGPRNLVGTLVNGAGLALNTIDTLSARLSAPPHATSAANFLDTGGKATSDTIKTSFKLVLSDPRVGVVFVNIFGGLTLCDMIAEGIILAFKELDVKKPVVVRLRGTNEAKGQKVLEDAKLPIHAFDDFEEAVKKVGELANVHAE
ncbi:SucD, Succinyl-CoA synthetase, alpha subunit [Pyrenophora tritici-repentis]|uniref:SucD, Succinyl-CoA synthetase, alpha subunit n=1 Tax=Pyrenophora tritici-repentis TaxID=45151 RepID=A0A834VWU4_9PLEO|nr:SucD, Succinyl-CoA synthetase, alpha subunit [Pyrenophora tritici-repentis]